MLVAGGLFVFLAGMVGIILPASGHGGGSGWAATPPRAAAPAGEAGPAGSGSGGGEGRRRCAQFARGGRSSCRGGTGTTDIDLSTARVDGVDPQGGADRIDLALPAPAGVLPVRMSGGVGQFRVRLRDAAPVRVAVGSGAGEATLDGATHRRIAPGEEFTVDGWNRGGTGIDLLAAAGMSALTVTLR